ncbi:hypothetical protein AKJ09_06878 [Labilithrix luteola]|uniref:Peptidase S1 domain-containing protein n=1 Tax=Labilithrix luteola TaxID=1391654 RepID=A0A0K1Q4C1_9BACT|nr:trypsin-like serine protease [Labilithrix luteola]AKV00215.1 hypothetical protein AKJ09_06878 [Labilithrix luteola]
MAIVPTVGECVEMKDDRGIARRRFWGALVAVSALAACSSAESTDDASSSANDLVGGRPDARWPAAGYLVHGATFDAAKRAPVSCGATLVAPNVVVTAAHCVLNASDDVWAFGTGDAGCESCGRSSMPVAVVSRQIHPQFHPAPEGRLDVKYYLRNFDVATLVLAAPIRGITPAALPTEKAAAGCDYHAIGYHTPQDGRTSRAQRVSANACVEFNVNLGGDPIFEVHPTGNSALCHGDGDEGSPAIAGDPDMPLLHGIYVGSVTQGLTDCQRGTQFLNGYEAMFGFRDFVEAGIVEGQKAL